MNTLDRIKKKQEVTERLQRAFRQHKIDLKKVALMDLMPKNMKGAK